MATNQVAVVTGATRGIGLAAVESLAKAHPDWTVVLAARHADTGKDRMNELKAKGLNNVVTHQLDVASDESVKHFAEWIKSTYGRVDVLVNNAGTTGDEACGFLESNLDNVRRVFESNTLGPLRLCQALIPLMKERNYGRIINVSSGAGQLEDMSGKYVPYRLSKVSLNALTRIMNDELKGTNIHVNSICPGLVDTDMGRSTGLKPPLTPEQGTESIMWLADQPDDGPRGGFFRFRKPIPW